MVFTPITHTITNRTLQKCIFLQNYIKFHIFVSCNHTFRNIFNTFANKIQAQVILTETIIDEFKKGSMEPFYTSVYPYLITYAARILGSDYSFLAEDCVQDVVFRLYEKRNEYNTVSHFKSALYTSIHNNAISYLRKNDSHLKFLSTQQEESEDFQASFIIQETLETLYEAIEKLPPKYHTIFELSFEQGLSIPEIANQLNLSVSGVKKQKSHMLDLLKSSLTDEALALLLVLLA